MKRVPLLGIAMIVTLTFTATACKPSEDLVLQREWTANAEYAGDLWASRVAHNHGIEIEIREGSEVIDPVRAVRSEAAHFGVASADRVLRENEGGAGLVIIAAATHQSPVVFLTKKELSIDAPSKFRGRTVGIQAGTNTELIFKALLKSQGLSSQDMKVVESGWGTTTFETGTIDVLGAFAYDEPIALAMKGKHFGQIEPETFGVRYVGTVYFTRKDLATSNPALVQAFMDALVEGWTKALADPHQALRMLSEDYESIRNNQAKERKSLDAGKRFFIGDKGRILYASEERWNEMGKSLVELGELKSFDFDANVDYHFLEKADAR